MSSPKFHFAIFIFFILLTGCMTPGNKKAEVNKETVLLKIKNYENLFNDLQNKKLTQGISQADVRTRYGEPDDIFTSGSTTGSFEHWTYEKILEKDNPQAWHPIRLYFDNSKLIDWKF